MPRILALVCLLAALVVTTGAAAGPNRNGLIAFVRCCAPAGIFVTGPEGGGERRIYHSAFDDAPVTPAWSPNGRQIAFVPGAHRRGVWIMRGDGSRRHRLTPGKGDAVFPSWSPDARRIVFADRPGDLYVVRIDGSGLRRMTRGAAYETHPAWSPRGGWIAYERDRDLWRMRPDGSLQRRLVRNGSSPGWSPGGTQVAFLRRGNLWVVRRDGTGARLIADLDKEQAGLAWSPDGRWLVAAPLDRGDLTLVRADGSATRSLTDAGEHFHAWPSWQPLS